MVLKDESCDCEHLAVVFTVARDFHEGVRAIGSPGPRTTPLSPIQKTVTTPHHGSYYTTSIIDSDSAHLFHRMQIFLAIHLQIDTLMNLTTKINRTRSHITLSKEMRALSSKVMHIQEDLLRQSSLHQERLGRPGLREPNSASSAR